MQRVMFGLMLIAAVLRIGYAFDWDFSRGNREWIRNHVQDDGKGNLLRRFEIISANFRSLAADKIQEILPSPHSELVMGMVLGENRFNDVSRYNDVLKAVGLIHVVVVSGYNISLVFTLFTRFIGSQYKARNLVVGLFVTLIYAGISGFGVPAIRAWIMGSVAATFRYYGRSSQGIVVLIFSALAILVAAPEQLFSISFQLSFLATLGVMLVPVSASLGAQLLVNPLISYYFGTVSIAALIANPLVLWVVPVCTVFGGILVGSVFVSQALSHVLSTILFPFLDFFVQFSEFFAGFNFASVSVKFNIAGILVYYAVLSVLLVVVKKLTRMTV